MKYSLHRVEEKLSVEVLGNTECLLEAGDFNFDKSASLHVFFFFPSKVYLQKEGVLKKLAV